MRETSAGSLCAVIIVCFSLTSLGTMTSLEDSADSGWQTATPIETDDSDGYSPQVVVDNMGNALAVWNQHTLDPWSLSAWSSRYVIGEGWGNPEHLTTPYVDPDMAVDASGNVVVVWRAEILRESQIMSSRYVSGSGWETASAIGIYRYEHDPKVAVDESGNAIAVWVFRPSLTWSGEIWSGETIVNSVIGSNRYEVGSGWGDPTLIGVNATADATEPQVAVDGSGNAMVVWRQYDGTHRSVWANRYEVGSGWETATPIEAFNGNTTYPQIAMDAAGNAIAVWGQWDDGPNSIWSNRYVVGEGWGVPTLIETDDGEAHYPQIAIDSFGNAIAVWPQHDGTKYSIWANRYVAGNGWGTATLIETNNSVSAAEPQVAVTASGDAIAVWRQWNGSFDEGFYHSIGSNRYIAGEGWGSATVISTRGLGGSDAVMHLEVAVDPRGNAIAVWSQFDDTCYNVWSSRYVDPDSSPSSLTLTITVLVVLAVAASVVFLLLRKKTGDRGNEPVEEELPPPRS